MSREQKCAKCGKCGTEAFSRCGHILHKNCLRSSCSKCNIEFASPAEVEEFFGKLYSLGLESPEIKELYVCYENFIGENGYIIYHYNKEILGKLQKLGWDINKRNFGGPDMFYQACRFDDLDKVNLLIDHGLDLSKYGSWGLSRAHSSIKVFDRLIKLGVKVDNKIIFSIINRNNFKMLSRVLKEGVDINFENIDGSNRIRPIHCAAQVGSIGMVKYLIENGADFTLTDRNGSSLLHYACYSENNLELVKYLIESGFDIETQNDMKQTPLLVAIEKQFYSIVQLLIEYGVNINHIGKYGNNPLHDIASKSNTDIMKILISKGANVNAKNNEGKTPLHVVSRGIKSKSANLLLDNGADVNALDNSGNPPLYYLYPFNLDDEELQKFVDKGADFEIKDKEGKVIRDLILKKYPNLKV